MIRENPIVGRACRVVDRAICVDFYGVICAVLSPRCLIVVNSEGKLYDVRMDSVTLLETAHIQQIINKALAAVETEP